MYQIPKFAVILSGCGVFDGSEIHEAVCTMLAIDKAGAEYQCFAPDIRQAKTVDHFTGQTTASAGDGGNRNVLAEAARIARGNIKPLNEFKTADFNAVVFPGGFGAVTNWSDFAAKGSDCDVNEEIRRTIEESYAGGLVIGAMCIAPVVIARVLGKHKVRVTIGTDKDIACEINKTGAVHETGNSAEVCVDIANKIVTTPCYMLDKSIKDVCRSTENLVKEIMGLFGA